MQLLRRLKTTVATRPALTRCVSSHAAPSSLKIMFLGAPGAGKGTYASRIAPLLQIPTISTGDLVRHEIKHNTELGRKIKEYNDRGALVPDEIILDMVAQRLKEDDAKAGFILDGFPRTLTQAEEFAKVVEFDLVVNIDLPQWILVEKISGRRVCKSCGTGYNVAYINHGEYNMPPLLPKVEGVCDGCGGVTLVQRPDDNEDVVRKRLEVYNDETAPLIDFYADKGSLRTFEVKRGLADLDKLVHLIQSELHGTVEIGGVVVPVKPAAHPELVPRGYLPQNREYSQELLSHLRWMLQKDLLKQDMFLIGPPGASRRLLSMRFCELLNREVEYIAISQDTTESDLKQRREIVDGAAIFTDQAPVRAAINGRVLVIDGLEKAERNVLPTLNNLLENREMTLDDGRFLMKAESYDALLKAGYSRADLKAQNLVRVHPDFRVIALGVPVPPYPGRTLDPPLRSRFQARNVPPASPGTQLEALVSVAPNVPLATLEKLVGIREAVNTVEAMHDGVTTGGSAASRMPHFDYLSLSHCAQVLNAFPDASLPNTVRRVFPVMREVLGAQAASHADTLTRILKKYNAGLAEATYTVDAIATSGSDAVGSTARVSFRASSTDSRVEVDVPCGVSGPLSTAKQNFVETDVHARVLANMLQDHAVGADLCILGPKGSGKSELARLFAHRLGYALELFSLFKDMTARDLLQRRATDASGNTRWEDSPLVHAARHGHLVVLDGVHRLGSDSLGVLQRLVQDREIDLADGTKLLGRYKYDEMLSAAQAQDPTLSALDGVFPIHPSFRIIAIAESDAVSTSGNGTRSAVAVPGRDSVTAWLNSDSIAMFTFHALPSLTRTQQEQIVRQLYPQLPEETTQMLLQFSEKLSHAKDTSSNTEYASLQFSLRQLLRACRRLNAFPQQSLHDLRPLIHDTLLTQFLPSSCARLVNDLLDECGAPATTSHSRTASDSAAAGDGDTIREEDGRLFIGDVSHPIKQAANPELVPQPHFFEIPRHIKTMKEMLQDVVAGQKHLLMIGNQGVGKNKLTDRLLQLLQHEREYIQLHRDTTVQTLTLVPTLENGRIVWEDSPLVRAAKLGRTLVVDEADKAPLEVVCVLKGLIEDGEMLLGNGKRLIDPTKVELEAWRNQDDVIVLHPEFRMWVLANRPGFPFLGNNFFREIGDVFASHAIDNPDEASELALLRAYAPGVPEEILRRLCQAFAELRDLVDQGIITYPYSTREAVAVARHLEAFPNDGVTSVLENVLAFDAYDKNLRKQLTEVFLRHGIPLSSPDDMVKMEVRLAETRPLPAPTLGESWTWRSAGNELVADLSQPKALPPFVKSSSLKRRQVWLDPATTKTYAVEQRRAKQFTEEVASCRVPMKANRQQKASALAVLPDDSMHVLTTRPMSLHSFSSMKSTERTHKVLEIENQYMQWETNPVMMSVPERKEIVVFLPSTGMSLMIDPATGNTECFTLPDGALDGRLHDKRRNAKAKRGSQNPFTQFFQSSSRKQWRVLRDSNGFVRFEQGGSIVQLIDAVDSQFVSLDLSGLEVPIEEIANVQAVQQNKWLVHTTNEDVVYQIEREQAESTSAAARFVIREAAISKNNSSLGSTRLSLFASNESASSDGRTMVHAEAFLQQLRLSDNGADVMSALRPSEESRWAMTGAWSHPGGEFVFNTKSDEQVTDMEVTYPIENETKTIVLRADERGSNHSRRPTSDPTATLPRVVGAAVMKDGDHALTLEEDGSLRMWQLDAHLLTQEMELWKQMFGVDGDGTQALELKVNSEVVTRGSVPRTGLDAPKHGKEDPNNDPHVGGNTWAGGTGGSDTAGLGGRGGPYRLDKGHPVHQVSQAKKDEVSAEARAKARAMAEQALAAKLEEISMSEREWETYQAYFSRVERESSQLRSILENLESVAQERTWLKHQSSGELDDGKLVDGVTGERLVFKRRGVSDSPFQAFQQQTKPKRMLFVMDVSGSMYRFNGQDGRLERVLETSLMIMESFAGFESKFDYCILGHSGDSPEIPFVEFGAAPKDRKERLKVLQRMVAHSQYCMSGDNTVEAIDHAVKRVTEADGDDYFVFVVSDANLERYGISPRRMGRQLIADPRVKAHAIFIASFADEADRIMKELPHGRGHVCLDTTELPRTFKKIFTTAFNQ
ncbi:hypothetical protein PINS_up000349 [Pythium insidiosum]|nr:hypothetical protein PINS_up000349 [Pythium insidiosum]